MDNRRRRTSDSTDGPEQHTPRLERDYVAEVQRRVAKLTRESERAPGSGAGTSLVDKQRQRVEQEMASLRAEALKARRLAEQIQNLSHGTTRPERKSVMTESSTTSPRHLGQSQRKAHSPRSGARQLSFNPLHPSMELPPEQLIRLLGLENKKTRKGKKAQAHAPDESPRASARHSEIREKPVNSAPLIAPVSRRHRRGSTDFNAKRQGILLPALVIGVMVGVAAAGYLFLSKPTVATTPPAASEAGTAKTPGSRQLAEPRQPAGKQVRPDAPAATVPPTGKPAQTAPANTATPADPDRQAPREAELAKLRAEAEQRFARQMSAIEASRESNGLRGVAVEDSGSQAGFADRPTAEADPGPDHETGSALEPAPELQQSEPQETPPSAITDYGSF